MQLSKIWAITAYYNPIGYSKRFENYKKFKQFLNVPLLTVELSFSTNYEITEDDADIVIHVKSDSVLWHKERLLNIALSNLPPYVEYVAWLDCDIIFCNPNWHEEVCLKLQSVKLCQLFSRMYDLKPGINHIEVDTNSLCPTGNSVASIDQTSIEWNDAFRPKSTSGMRRNLFGLGWAARRDTIESFGFYDMMIIGSGDRALACAGYGKFDDAIKTGELTGKRRDHYLNWASSFYEHVQGKIGCLKGDIFHLWHGDLINRKYLERHQSLCRA